MKSQDLKVSRKDVYKAIDSERDYQEQLGRNDVTDQRPLEQLALIRHILSKIDANWYTYPGQVDMNEVRKIAGIAVRCMEQHGAPSFVAHRNKRMSKPFIFEGTLDVFKTEIEMDGQFVKLGDKLMEHFDVPAVRVTIVIEEVERPA